MLQNGVSHRCASLKLSIKGGYRTIWASAKLSQKISRDMGYHSDSIAVSRDTGPLRIQQTLVKPAFQGSIQFLHTALCPGAFVTFRCNLLEILEGLVFFCHFSGCPPFRTCISKQNFQIVPAVVPTGNFRTPLSIALWAVWQHFTRGSPCMHTSTATFGRTTNLRSRKACK